jgi:hypothetical protein
MATYSGVYTAYMNAVSVSGAITLVQVKAGASNSLHILRASVAQSSSTTSTQQRVQIVRKTGAATVTSFTPIRIAGEGTPTAAGGTSATGTNASGEGTDGDIMIADVFNILNGWLWVQTPEEYIHVPGGGIIGLKFPAAPSSAITVTASITFGEVG